MIAMGVVPDGRTDLRPVGDIDNQRPNGVRAIIQTDCILGHQITSNGFSPGYSIVAGSGVLISSTPSSFTASNRALPHLPKATAP